jgi:hypothetical protein
VRINLALKAPHTLEERRQMRGEYRAVLPNELLKQKTRPLCRTFYTSSQGV